MTFVNIRSGHEIRIRDEKSLFFGIEHESLLERGEQ